MRSFLFLVCILGAGAIFWTKLAQRSVTIPLLESGYTLTYTMAWHLGMQERLTVREAGKIWSHTSTKWTDTWEKPYRSGGVIYASEDSKTFYVTTSYMAGVIAPDAPWLVLTCSPNELVIRTPFGDDLHRAKNWEEKQRLDPGAQRFPDYLEKGMETPVIAQPVPASRYYEGLRYMGRFGVISGGRRGSGVGFASHADAPEPQLVFGTPCG